VFLRNHQILRFSASGDTDTVQTSGHLSNTHETGLLAQQIRAEE
jgi:hypothetical protein